jgi:hypothetical protein
MWKFAQGQGQPRLVAVNPNRTLMAETKQEKPPLKVFIVGAPRSGTSILVFALKSTFDLPGFGESHVMPLFQRMVHHMRAYVAGFTNINDPMMLKKLSKPDLEQYLFEYTRRFYQETFPAGRWVDKTPTGEAVFGLPLIETIFPDARLIMIKRNGIEVVSSHVKKFSATFEDACFSWSNAMKGLLHARGACRNLLQIDQYDLQNDSEQVSLRIAEHLGVPERAGALSQYFSENRVEGSSTHDPKLRLRLADMNWPDNQKEQFKRQCAGMMSEFGYEL